MTTSLNKLIMPQMARTPIKGFRAWDKRGEDCSWSKLTEEEIYAIRSDTRSKRVIARQYGIVHSTVIHIQQRKIWGWLP